VAPRAPQRADPVVTVVGLSLPTLVGGAVLTETVLRLAASGGSRSARVRARLSGDHGREPDRGRRGDHRQSRDRSRLLPSSTRGSPTSERRGGRRLLRHWRGRSGAWSSRSCWPPACWRRSWRRYSYSNQSLLHAFEAAERGALARDRRLRT
jgi:hypothetical protein